MYWKSKYNIWASKKKLDDPIFRNEYKICKFLNVPPNSPALYNLTSSEKLWILSNIRKDEDDEFEKIKTVLKILKPEAFKNDEDLEVIDAQDSFIKDIEEKVGRELTQEELYRLKNDPEFDLNEIADEVTVIKRVE